MEVFQMKMLAKKTCAVSLTEETIRTAKLHGDDVRIKVKIFNPITMKREKSIFINDRRSEIFDALFDNRLSGKVISRPADVTVKEMSGGHIEIYLDEPEDITRMTAAVLKEYSFIDERCLNTPNHLWKFPEISSGLPKIGIQIQ